MAGFREAVLNGQPSDGGLYFPEMVPKLDEGIFYGQIPHEELLFRVMRPYVGRAIPEIELLEICRAATDRPFPLVQISERISVIELFHGPTLAFKDVGARFISRCLSHFSAERAEKAVVVVATSGDTGGAVADAFSGVEGVDVVILFPKGGVTNFQRAQLAGNGRNVITLEVQGTFDECQAMAKMALSDKELRKQVILTSANSINIARWLPQQVFYVLAVRNCDGGEPVVSVPSGNFGNLAAGMLVQASGLGIKRLVAACNSNDTVPRFLETGEFKPGKTVSTMSNAMDVSKPSNFVRILEMVGGDLNKLRSLLSAHSISDLKTAETMRTVYDRFGYTLDPHGAVGFAALDAELDRTGGRGIVMETAHPRKFETVREVLGLGPVSSGPVETNSRAKNSFVSIEPDYLEVKEIILSRT